MQLTLLLLTLTLCGIGAEGMPELWLTGNDGGCRVLVSERTGSGGMFGQGYAPCVEPEGPRLQPFCTEPPLSLGGGRWVIPVSPINGWFVTAEEGEFSGFGESSGCEQFRWACCGATSDVIWTAPGPGEYRIEAAFAEDMGIIYYYGHTIVVEGNASNSTGSPLMVR
eukprot:SAG31_NODE_845_length_11547_cov_8.098096_8_plen_167_part_00